MTIAGILRALGIRRRNVVTEIHKDAIDRLNRQLINARLRADVAERKLAELQAKRSATVAKGNRTRRLNRLAREGK